MSAPRLDCLDDRRRLEVRRAQRNGLDYLEVSDDQRTLTVYFLGPAPEGLTNANVRIRGGRRVRDIRVTDVEICPRVDPELDNCMVVTVDRPGDFSAYHLCLVDLPEDTRFDPRYRCLDFTFKASCPTDLDCGERTACPSEARSEPEISYLAKDYASFRRLVLDRLAAVMPGWTERHVPDVGITLVELLAYVGDYLSYHQDAVATEAYLDTARQRISVRRHARLVDYRMHEGCNARAWLHAATSTDITLPARGLAFLTGFDRAPEVEDRLLTWDDLREVPPSRYEVFEPLLDDADGAGEGLVRLWTAHNEIHVHTWGEAECCLPRGATSATLVDGGRIVLDGETPERALHLHPGDVLVFEEVVGPRTGDPADADPAHRHAVRLTRVEPATDDLLGQPVLEIEWADEDALPFPLCLSLIGPPPECALLEGVSVARANVHLVHHGRELEAPEDLGPVPTAADEATCVRRGRPSDAVRRAGRYRPVLGRGPLTFSQPLAPGAPASRATLQDPREALPWVRVDAPDGAWTARPDLFDSHGDDRHFVVEMDDRRRAHLRFGDGEVGRALGAGEILEARYRVGNGPTGNVGADTITLVVATETVSGVTLKPRNPLAAMGGTAPEPASEVKLFAPYVRRELARAVTADDYASLAERHPQVQGAAAELRWNGSWYEARVAIDPLGRAEADEVLLQDVRRFLYHFRHIGHDLAVRPARYVAIDLALEVCVVPGFVRGHVEAALRRSLGARCLPDGSRGFFHPDELTFGVGVATSRLVAVAQAVPGVRSVVVRRLERLFEGPAGEIEQGLLSIGALEIARLDGDPSFPENGRIAFDMRGGR